MVRNSCEMEVVRTVVRRDGTLEHAAGTARFEDGPNTLNPIFESVQNCSVFQQLEF